MTTTTINRTNSFNYYTAADKGARDLAYDVCDIMKEWMEENDYSNWNAFLRNPKRAVEALWKESRTMLTLKQRQAIMAWCLEAIWITGEEWDIVYPDPEEVLGTYACIRKGWKKWSLRVAVTTYEEYENDTWKVGFVKLFK